MGLVLYKAGRLTFGILFFKGLGYGSKALGLQRHHFIETPTSLNQRGRNSPLESVTLVRQVCQHVNVHFNSSGLGSPHLRITPMIL
jgi:hypothetical protein